MPRSYVLSIEEENPDNLNTLREIKGKNLIFGLIPSD
jgi:hypothetical protein